MNAGGKMGGRMIIGGRGLSDDWLRGRSPSLHSEVFVVAKDGETLNSVFQASTCFEQPIERLALLAQADSFSVWFGTIESSVNERSVYHPNAGLSIDILLVSPLEGAWIGGSLFGSPAKPRQPSRLISSTCGERIECCESMQLRGRDGIVHVK